LYNNQPVSGIIMQVIVKVKPLKMMQIR